MSTSKKQKIFRTESICFGGCYHISERGANRLEKMVFELGGSITYSTAHATIFIAGEKCTQDNSNFRMAFRRSIRILTPQWIMDCYEKNDLLPLVNYFADVPAGKKKKLSRKRKRANTEFIIYDGEVERKKLREFAQKSENARKKRLKKKRKKKKFRIKRITTSEEEIEKEIIDLCSESDEPEKKKRKLSKEMIDLTLVIDSEKEIISLCSESDEEYLISNGVICIDLSSEEELEENDKIIDEVMGKNEEKLEKLEFLF